MSGPGTAVTRSAEQQLQEDRWERSQQILAERAQAQLAEMSDEDFARQLTLMKKARERIERVIREPFVRGKHFGNPEDKKGRKAFAKDICLQGGSDLLQQVFRLHVTMIDEPVVIADESWCQVTIRAGIFNQFGGELGQTIASCNTYEARFYNWEGKPSWKRDPREKLNDCQAMALKRAAVRLSLAVTGGSAYFVSDEALAEALEVEPCTKEERDLIRAAAKAAGMAAAEFWRVALEVTGRQRQPDERFPLVASEEVDDLIRAIGEWRPRTPVPTEVVQTPPPATARVDDPHRDRSFDDMPDALTDREEGFPA